jgi:hypothetical protein
MWSIYLAKKVWTALNQRPSIITISVRVISPVVLVLLEFRPIARHQRLSRDRNTLAANIQVGNFGGRGAMFNAIDAALQFPIR